jgi:hypothetical protein
MMIIIMIIIMMTMVIMMIMIISMTMIITRLLLPVPTPPALTPLASVGPSCAYDRASTISGGTTNTATGRHVLGTACCRLSSLHNWTAVNDGMVDYLKSEWLYD